MASFDYLKDLTVQRYEQKVIELENYEKELENASDDRLREYYQKIVNLYKKTVSNLKYKKDYMRENNEEDINEREKIRKTYPKLVKEMIPDKTPIVFHGVSNIGIVEEIIKSGGLLSCEEQGISNRSFASDIDVCYKDNIRVSVDFSNSSYNEYMPYGAIFAFRPLDSEIDKVIKTGDSSEVLGGVSSVNFKNEPDRLYGIITTKENITRVKKWCLKYGIDHNKVFNHKQFLLNCEKIFKEPMYKHGKK